MGNMEYYMSLCIDIPQLYMYVYVLCKYGRDSRMKGKSESQKKKIENMTK